MSQAATETRSVVIEREMPFAPERIWRALTQPLLIADWLMSNDFQPVPGHRFVLRADWGAVDCRVLELEPNRTLSYTWAAYGLESVVVWTLTPTRTGTRFAWSNRVSGRIRSKPIRARKAVGRAFSMRWSECWRGRIERAVTGDTGLGRGRTNATWPTAVRGLMGIRRN